MSDHLHVFTHDSLLVRSENFDIVYKTYLRHIMSSGEEFTGRNGITKALFGSSIKVDLRAGFPLTRLRKMPFKNLIREFLFDVGKSQNVEALGSAKHFWDFLADENGELGASAYNRQWRMWPPSKEGSEVPNEQLETGQPVDQLNDAAKRLLHSPNTRQATVITHNPTAIDPACPPCHIAMQFMPNRFGYVDMMVPARSNDMVVGFPLDIARYAIILSCVAEIANMKPRYVYMPSANSHIYENCFDFVAEMVLRESRDECELGIVHKIRRFIDDFELEDFKLIGYDPHPAMKVSVN